MARGAGSGLPRGIFERPCGSKIYWICYAGADGRTRREKVGPHLKLAMILYQKRKTESFESRKLPEISRREIKFSDLAADFLEYAKIHHKPTTQRTDTLRLERLLREFRDRPVERILPQDLVRFLGSEKWTPATRNRYRALLSKCFSLAIRNGHLKENPAAKLERFKENNERVRFLETREERRLRKVIREMSAKHEPEFDLALHTGLRRGEQYHLRWPSVDLKRRLLTVADSKSHRPRHIALDGPAAQALKKLRARALESGSEYVVPAAENARAGNYPGWFEACVRRAKVRDLHWHDLRHTFASRHVMAGTDLRTVQVLLGHASIVTTQRYAHLSSPHLAEAAARLERYTLGASTATRAAPTGRNRTERAIKNKVN